MPIAPARCGATSIHPNDTPSRVPSISRKRPFSLPSQMPARTPVSAGEMCKETTSGNLLSGYRFLCAGRGKLRRVLSAAPVCHHGYGVYNIQLSRTARPIAPGSRPIRLGSRIMNSPAASGSSSRKTEFSRGTFHCRMPTGSTLEPAAIVWQAGRLTASEMVG
jgi:hypothetical protein